jgi:hypothetical protein
LEVGGVGGEGRGGLRRRRNESGSASSRRKAADTKAPLAQREMELEGGGRRVQPCCAGVRLAVEREASLAKVCVLLEVRAGLSLWNGPEEVLEPWLQGAEQDHPLVLASERMRVVDELMDSVANLDACEKGSRVRIGLSRWVRLQSLGRREQGGHPVRPPPRPPCLGPSYKLHFRRRLGLGQTPAQQPQRARQHLFRRSDDTRCRVCRDHALEGPLECKSEQEGAKRIPLLNAAGGEDGGGVVWCTSEEYPRQAAVLPG